MPPASDTGRNNVWFPDNPWNASLSVTNLLQPWGFLPVINGKNQILWKQLSACISRTVYMGGVYRYRNPKENHLLQTMETSVHQLVVSRYFSYMSEPCTLKGSKQIMVKFTKHHLSRDVSHRLIWLRAKWTGRENPEAWFVMHLGLGTLRADRVVCLCEGARLTLSSAQSLPGKARSNMDLAAKPQGTEKGGGQQQAFHLSIPHSAVPSPYRKAP